MEKFDIIKQKNHPKLLNRNQGLSPIGAVAKILKKSIMTDKNQTKSISFVFFLIRLQEFRIIVFLKLYSLEVVIIQIFF